MITPHIIATNLSATCTTTGTTRKRVNPHPDSFSKLSATLILLLVSFFLLPTTTIAQDTTPQPNALLQSFLSAKRVVFIGDSNTYNGQFLASVELSLIQSGHAPLPEILNLGLSSETCCGLSEPAHPWPRPNVLERFERLLDKAKPDLVVACYGMNDGIYHPFAEARFQKFKDGIDELIDQCQTKKVKLVLITPPPFDPLPKKRKGSLAPADAKEFNWKTIYENYDAEVMLVYSQWLLQKKDNVVGVIDTRTAILEHLSQKRKTKPDFALSRDGVHINQAGHKLFAGTITTALGLQPAASPPKTIELLVQRNNLLRDAWLQHVGHLRPDVPNGLPLDQANKQATELNKKIASELNKQPSAN